MTASLDDAVNWVKSLPDDDQERVARALFAFADERSEALDDRQQIEPTQW